MDKNYNKQSKNVPENLQYDAAEELQQICKNDSDDNDEFFDADEIPEKKTAKTSTDSKTASEPDNVNKSEENSKTFTSGSACAVILPDSLFEKSFEQNQSIDIKSAEGDQQIAYPGSDEYVLEPHVLYSRIPSSNEVEGFNSNTQRFHQSCTQALTFSSVQALERDGGNPLDAFEKHERKEENPQMKRDPSFENETYDFCTDECPKHCLEIIKYVCNSCDKLACPACITVEHKHCESNEFLPSFVTKPDFCYEDKCIQFETEIGQIRQRLTHNKNKIYSNMKGCEIMRANAKSDLKKQRDDLKKLFDCYEKDLDRKIWNMENSDKEKMQLLLLKQEDVEKEFQLHVEDYHRRRNSGNKVGVFTKIRMSRGDTDELKKRLEKLETDNTFRRYVYTPSKLVTNFTKSVTGLGNIEEVDSKMKRNIKSMATINMRVEADQNACKISGLDFLSENLLIAVDYANSSVKVIDICSNELITAVPTSPEPFDVTVVCDNRQPTVGFTSGEIVLTFPKENKIRFMDLTLLGSFSVKRDAQTNGQCRSLIYSKDKLFMTFPNKGKIEIIDMQGQLLRRITTETIGRIFQPQVIAMDTEQSTIFVSDNANHAVISMTLDGEVKDTYTDYDLIQPRGLCVNTTGAIFVCSLETHKVHHLSSSCEGMSIMSVADDEHPVPFPFSIAYSDKKNTLYVGQFTMDCIKAYTFGSI